jgi:hypothetical protein
MSSMRDLLEKMNGFAGEKVGQKPGDQVRGSEPMPRKGGGKKHPYAGRLVGANESSGNLLKELDTVINSDPVKRDLFQEWQEYKSISEADKTVSPDQREQIRKDVKAVDYGKEPQPTTPPSPEQKAGIKQAVSDYNKDKEPKKQTVDEWGAAGTAVGPGNDDADPVEIAAQRAQQVAGKRDQQNQLMGLIGQVNGARSELANLNKQFPQGANPVEKAMSLQQQQAQRVQLGRQIEDLMSQVAALRSQA